jgi:hypothetical protein
VRSMSSRVAAQPLWRNGSLRKPQPWREHVQVPAPDPFHGSRFRYARLGLGRAFAVGDIAGERHMDVLLLDANLGLHV